jgi:hypothetical protein
MTIEMHKAGDASVAKKAPRAPRKSQKDNKITKVPPKPVVKETKPLASKYVVTKSGLGSYGGGVHSFKAGTVISDFFVINQLLQANADFIEPVNEDTVIRTCPHCKEKLVVHASDFIAKAPH